MWIRTQDKKHLVQCKGFSIVNNTIIGEYGEWLGAYSTEEKALKVLDMIQKRICDIEGMRLKVIMLNGDNRHIFITEGYVFQMPQDSEVE